MITTLFNRIISAILPTAQAHCDTADGPAVTDGRRSLETGELAHALKWIPASGEAELREVFTKAIAVRGLSADAAEIADRLFLETLVRLHRLAEGVGFTGIQPTGTEIEEVVVEADRALETGDLSPVLALVPAERRDELTRRFEVALGKRGFDATDVAAGRDYVASYVDYFKYAEGEDGHDHHGGGHGHDHGSHEPHANEQHHA